LSTLEIVPAPVRARLLKLLAVAAILYFAVHVSSLSKFFLTDAEGIGALLAIVGTLYSVLYAFAIYVIWSIHFRREPDRHRGGVAERYSSLQRSAQARNSRPYCAGSQVVRTTSG
jgi:hypothetical protein